MTPTSVPAAIITRSAIVGIGWTIHPIHSPIAVSITIVGCISAIVGRGISTVIDGCVSAPVVTVARPAAIAVGARRDAAD